MPLAIMSLSRFRGNRAEREAMSIKSISAQEAYDLLLAGAEGCVYLDVRSDWTRLSFGLYTYVALLVSFYGGDHLPPFSLMVILPAGAVLLGAFFHLLVRPRWARFLTLVVPIVIVALLNKPGENQINFWAFFLMAIIFFPALISLLPRREPSL